jgi:trk system potassium uptake protein TrkA
MTRVTLNGDWVGRRYSEVEAATSGRLAYVVRFGAGLIPGADTLVQDGDEPYLTFPTSAASKVERIVTRPPKSTDPDARKKPRAARGKKAAS